MLQPKIPVNDDELMQCHSPFIRRFTPARRSQKTSVSALMLSILFFAFGTHASKSIGGEPQENSAFPTTESKDSDLPDNVIEAFKQHVAGLVDRGEVVGVEVHLLKNGKTILHNSFGWADREAKRKLETDSIYCVRSMTKPLAGTSVQFLLQQEKLELQQKVASLLPAFNQPRKQDITIQHLLTHSSGLPFTTIRRPLGEYSSIQEVADEAASVELEFSPGKSFQYSDAGTDSLGAIIETVTGQSLETFLQENILKPLQMENAYTKLTEVPDRSRVPSAYSGGVGNWQRHWKKGDAPILPLFLASQGLYCTTTDYAKFLNAWLEAYNSGGNSFMPKQALERAFAPGWEVGSSATRFKRLNLTYGHQWMLYHDKSTQELEVFGHNGSDGTYAWAWPKQDMILLLFSQTRGSTAGIELEATIQRLLIDRDLEGYLEDRRIRNEAQKKLQNYVGLYWDEDVTTDYYAVSIEDNQLVFERPGKFRAVGKPTGEPDEFIIGNSLRFRFDAESSPSPAVYMTTSKRTERQVRHTAKENLPTVDTLLEKVRAAHGFSAWKTGNLLHLSGSMKMGPLGLSSSIEQWLDARRSDFRVKSWTSTAKVVTNGSVAAATGTAGKYEYLSGAAELQEVIAHPSAMYGDWHRVYDQLEMLRKTTWNGRDVYLVRAVAVGLPGKTIFVDAEQGTIVAEHSLQMVPGVGILGLQTTYSDFREVGGITLPFHADSKFSNKLLGSVVVQIKQAESVDVKDSAPEDLFELPPKIGD